MLLLLAGGGTGNGAWAKKVTYHILTLPFTVKTYNGDGDFHEKIRVEALQCTSDETTVGLPAQFISPLATGFRYWTKATSTYESLYDTGHGTKIINTKYDIYNCKTGDYACVSDEILEGASVGDNTDIYVTYEYNSSNGILDLNGGTNYNVAFVNSNIQKFLCFNRSRNNRVANALSSGLSGEELANDDFVVPENGSDQLGWHWSKWGPVGVFMGFKFTGEDPYNITIVTSYEGKELQITDAVPKVDNTGTVKPYAGSTLMAKVGASSLWFDPSNNIHYKIESGISDADKWTQAIYDDCYNKYYVTQKDAQFDIWNGFYRYESPTMNAFALLNNPKGDYMFVGSKMNQNKTQNQPNDKGQYYSYYDNYDKEGVNTRSQPYFKLQALNSSLPISFYEIKSYTVYVTTKGLKNQTLSASMKWSDARLDDALVDHIPDVLRRKYVNYTAYSDAAHKHPVSTFEDIKNANNGNNIYLDYTVSDNIPFKLLPTNEDYTNAQWYTMRMDGVANPKYIAYEGASNALVVTDGSGVAKGSNTASQVHQGENSAEAMVAFMGDPYELNILNRKACEDDSANKFIGCASDATPETDLSTNKTSSDISTWEIVYESTGVTGILLRQFNTASSTPKYIGLGEEAINNPVTYSETASRIRVVELEKVNYTYHIMRSDGSIAVKATVNESVGKPLQNWLDIPAIIRSPFLATATVTYYDQSDNVITNAPYDFSSNHDIYVRYSFETPPSASSDFNVTLNAEYIYTSSGNDNIYSKSGITTEALDDAYQWTLDYTDPYAVKITNKGKNKYIKIASTPTDNMALGWDAIANNAALFVVKQSTDNQKFYEVMYAAGDGYDAGDGVGITTQYFNIGRNISSTTENTVKLYKNTSYISGSNQLRFRLIGTTAHDVTYHLIDLSKTDLLQVTTRHTTQDAPYFPPRYRSPLVKTYYYWSNPACTTPISEIGGAEHVYVTYIVNDLVDLKAGQLYLMKYLTGEEFYQENGSDGRTTTKKKAIYPYCNGDGNFFIYDQDQYDLQQEGASSTRTRWAWYVESNVDSENAPKGDPYHVMIKSRQTESYPKTNSSEYNAYFMTYKPNGYDKVITGLGWPGMNSETATEYMVLGSEGQYQLVTTYTIPIDLNNDGDTEDEGEKNRYVVSSFEQYWKTYDTIRRKLLKQSKDDYPDNDNDPILVPSTPCLVTGFDDNRTYLTTGTEETTPGLGFHSYEKWAYAKRWNGYNNGYSSTEGTHETSKGWEKIEHWFQTVNMGEGYFDFVKTDINPVLILLDQHGWEIMRKPIPTDPEDPLKDAKYAAIRPYNSPMVKEYAFWATAKKRSGFHQYYLLSDRIGGDDFTSTDLTDLPPYTSKNVHDKKGNLNDQYVTYIVKDEYAQTYNPADKTAKPFLIEQGSKYASTSDGTTITKNDVSSVVSMQKHITNDVISTTEKWYVKPNANIDIEMGYNDTGHSWTNKKADGSWENKNPNAYDVAEYKDNTTAVYIDQTTEYKDASDADKKKIKEAYGFFSFSNGFDPYNIQISSVQAPSKYMKTNANGATLEEGSLVGSYPTDPNNPTDPDPDPKIAMGDNTTTISPAPKWYDSRNLAVTNATFMAVQDAAGNMQLMPRFDHATRMSEFGTLIAPTDAAVSTTYTKLYRPEVYEYLIIDNDGHESLRYKSGGDMTPQTPDHFRSPLATNFKYYATATKTVASAPGVEDTYSNITNEIEESLDGATLTENTNGNKVVYVRYEYNEEADSWNMLKGNWLTMQLNDKNVVYNDGIKQASGDKPSPVDTDDKTWQWKFAHNSQPDPYAIYIYNRSQSAGTKARTDRFALLYHSEGYYALAEAGVRTVEDNDYTYKFLNGYGMSTSNDASILKEASFKSTSGSFDGTKSQVKFTDDVEHSFVYKVYTNGGVEAISATQSQEDVYSNDWKPVLPREARTPLLNIDQYRYYEQSLTGNALSLLFGLYEDIIYTHYTAYNPNISSYEVPNVRNATDEDPVARGGLSNDVPIGLDGKRPYNIIWYQDNMMKSNGTSIISEPNKPLQFTAPYEWVFEGDDPYAIKIKNVGANKYIHEATTTTTNLSTEAEATPFMLLNKDDYDYGVFAKTGAANTMLSGHGDALTTGDPIKFIPFALSTLKVIYHLVIENINSSVSIPYAELDEYGNRVAKDNKEISGTTLRDLENVDGSEGTHVAGDKYQLGSTLNGTTYCYNAGSVSLGDAFEIPQVFYRPNVNYDYYIGGVYTNEWTEDVDMNSEYKGLKMTHMVEDDRLLNKIVWINVVYTFMGGLETNSGSGFVTGVNQNKWYTFETSDATPQLAEYTGSIQTKSGYATHYTNDYLWTPVGDPYGFKMYNRYDHKNVTGTDQVMTTEDVPYKGHPVSSENLVVKMNVDDTSKPYLPANSVYELLANSSTTPGYFRVHPIVNKKVDSQDPQYYIKNDNGVLKLNTTPTEWTFGLSEELMRPYYQAAGYVGGLNDAGKNAYDKVCDDYDKKIINEFTKLITLQDVVYNHDNNNSDPDNPNFIVHYTPGYYRLHSQPGSQGISTPRYASGYTHKIELTAGDAGAGIPLHFYEVEEYDVNNPTFKELGTAGTDFTETAATRGDIPIVTVDKDPASIFYFYQGSAASPTTKIQTQGLFVEKNKMTATEGSATSFDIVDIGAGIVALQQHGGTNFLKYAQTNPKYDLKFDETASTVESARWCMQPVQKGTTAGDGEMALTATTNNGGDENYYTTFYAPFDVLLTDEKDEAFVLPELPDGGWPTTKTTIHLKKIGQYNTAGTYAGKSNFIPARTPVIIRTKNTGGEITMALPTTTPSSEVSCVFTGEYLEQMLAQSSTDYVFAFGRPYTHSNEFTYDGETGIVTPAGLEVDKGVGFYINASNNRESNATKTMWTRNNKYVYGNKIYYLYSSPSGSRELTRSPEFIPVVFDDDEGEEDEPIEESLRQQVFNGCVYDLQGRCVATEEMVKDGTWRHNLKHGIYILNGKKIYVK